jgi:hypothetical protein
VADWLRLTPEGGPERVQRARAAAQRLVDQLRDDQTALEAARVELTQSEQRDREALAQQMRAGAGEDAISDTQVETTRAAVRAAERRLEARRLAVEDAQQEYRAEIEAARSEWLRTSQRAAEKAVVRARKQLEQLGTDLDALREARALQSWLTPGGGLDAGQQVGIGTLGVAKSSGFHMANGEPRGADQLLAWLGEVIEPEPTPQSPAEPVAAR